MKILKLTFLLLVVNLCIVIIFQYLNLDIYIQNFLYDPSTGWLISRNQPTLRFLFYNLPKLLLIIAAIISLLYLVLFYLKIVSITNQTKTHLLHFLLAVILIPSLTSFFKYISNISCPHDLAIYNGAEPYYRLFEAHIGPVSGSCFPAGHASGGLALISLFYILKNKLLALALFLTFSVSMGLYQTLNGAHFTSHFLVSVMISLWINACLFYFLNKQYLTANNRK